MVIDPLNELLARTKTTIYYGPGVSKTQAFPSRTWR
jgi:hypothetical protein